MSDRPLVVGKGSLEKRAPGVWRYRHNLGKDPETGKYRYSPWRTIHTTKKREAEAAMEQYKLELNNGIYVQKVADTVGGYAKRFHDNRVGTITPLSYKREALDIKHIDQLLGKIKLQELRAFMIEDAYAKARKEETFSESELNKIHTKLRQVLDRAVRDELIAKNPASTIAVPRPKPEEREYLSPEEAARLRDTALKEPSACSTCVLLMLDTGMRRGEALGLVWENVLLDERAIYIKQQFTDDKEVRSPKSKRSVRKIAVSEWLVDYLRKWKAQQKSLLGECRLKPTSQTPLVHIVTRDKEAKVLRVDFMDPNNFNRWFRKFCIENGFGTYSSKHTNRYIRRIVNGVETRRKYSEAEWEELQAELKENPDLRKKEDIYVYKTETRLCGYKGLHPHMLRHTQATLLIHAGVDMKTVQSRIGHESITTTLDIYGHASAASDAKASDAFSAVLDNAR